MKVTSKKQAKQVFKDLGGKNFMTPKVLEITHNNEFAIELSTDYRQEMFGVSVRDAEGENSELSRMFMRKKEAILYMNKLGAK